MGGFEHFHEERVNWRVTDQFEEKKMLQAFQANRS